MESTFLLPLLLIVPLAGAAVCALLPDARLAKTWALIVTLATAAVGVVLAVQFPWSDPAGRAGYGLDPMNNPFYLDQFGFGIRLATDAVGLWLVLLTVGLMPLAIAASFESIVERQKEYYAWMLVLLAAMLGVFVSQDLLLFYIFFELTLIPMFFIIGIWGGPERRYAAGKFFLFTFAGSVFTLAAALFLALNASGGPEGITFDIDAIRQSAPAIFERHPHARLWVCLGLLAGFAVKVPLFPVHTWLPLAHTEAPTAGSVILAGVLLKLGTFGLYKIAVPFALLDGSGGVALPRVLTVIGVFCVIGIIYGALVAWVQQDIKKLVAYSSVSHLGFCVLGLVALNDEGVGGSVLYMINHGLSTGAMFLVIGMIYDRFHTRDINELSGLARRMPKLAFFFVLFVLSSIGLPGLNGFVSEFLTILGAFTSKHLGIAFGVLAATGIVLGAIYMLHMTARVIWGPLKYPGMTAGGGGHQHTQDHGPVTAHGQADHGQGASPGHDGHGHGHGTLGVDIGAREMGVLIPLALAVVILGVKPNLVLTPISGPIKSLTAPAAAPQDPAQQTAETPKALEVADATR